MTKRNLIPTYHSRRGGQEEYFALELTEERSNYGSGEYNVLTTRVVVVDGDGYRIVTGNGYEDFTFYSEAGHEIEHVTTRCQCDTSEGKRSNPYGFNINYQSHDSVNLRQAEDAVKVLGKVDRYMSKVSEENGSPDTYGAWLIRVAKSLGCTFIRIRNAKGDYVSDWLQGDRRLYHAYKLGAAKDAVNYRVDRWINAEKYAAEERAREIELATA